MISTQDFDDARGNVAILRAQIDDEIDRLLDEEELLQAQIRVQTAVVQRASALVDLSVNEGTILQTLMARTKSSVSREELIRAQGNQSAQRAQLEEERFRLAMIGIQIKHVKRRLRQLNPSGELGPSDREEAAPGKPAAPASGSPAKVESPGRSSQ